MSEVSDLVGTIAQVKWKHGSIHDAEIKAIGKSVQFILKNLYLFECFYFWSAAGNFNSTYLHSIILSLIKIL